MRDFELELSELIGRYRNKYERQKVIEALNAQAGLLVGDDGWIRDRPEPEPEPAPEPETAWPQEQPGEPMPGQEPTAPTAA